MMPFTADIWFVVKLMVLVGMVVYLIFALVIIRQVWHMTSTLKVGFEAPIKTIALTHFIAAACLFIFSIMYL